MFRHSRLVGVVTALLLLTVAPPAQAQVFPPASIPPADSTNPNDQRIRSLMDSFELTALFLDNLYDSFFDYLDDAYDDLDDEDWEAFQNDVINLQLIAGQYAEALTSSLYEEGNALLTLDPSLLDIILGYIDDRIDDLQDMIDALKELQNSVPSDSNWPDILGTDISNLESLIGNLRLFQLVFMLDYTPVNPPPQTGPTTTGP